MPTASNGYPVTASTTTRWAEASDAVVEDMALLEEEPLSIRVQGKPYVVVMRTPGDEKAHAAGLCLAEGIIDTPADVAAIAVCDGSGTNVVTVTLNEDARARMTGLSDRREWVSQTGCGLCGKQIVEELFQEITPITRSVRLPPDLVRRCVDDLPNQQPLRALTRASHAAALYDISGGLLTAAEDVGRHNALDKAVGKLFLEHRLEDAALLVLSSRISYELVQKAARARIPIIAAMSRPTTLAVTVAKNLNIGLCSLASGGGLFIYTHHQRLHPPSPKKGKDDRNSTTSTPV